MKASTVVTRAYSGLDKGTQYVSPGKMPSFDSNTWPLGSVNDCSGFVNWCLRFSQNRKVDHPLYKKVNGGWFETSAIYEDGLASTGYFSRIDEAIPGAFLVYPDYVSEDKKHHQGHIGVVIEANGAGPSGVKKIIHCSLSASTNLNDAIQLTDASMWVNHTESIIVLFDGM